VMCPELATLHHVEGPIRMCVLGRTTIVAQHVISLRQGFTTFSDSQTGKTAVSVSKLPYIVQQK
jgi:hypothetical protein